jgi:hypothetical protein
MKPKVEFNESQTEVRNLPNLSTGRPRSSLWLVAAEDEQPEKAKGTA